MRREKKNYLAGLLITLFWWVVLAFMIIMIDPRSMAGINYLPFLGVLFLAVMFTSSLIMANTVNGLIVATGVILWCLLKIWNISNWFNGLLILGIILILLIYRWGKTKEIPDLTD